MKTRHQRLNPPKPPKQMDYTPRPRAVAVAVAGPARASVPIPKTPIRRDEAYRRLVAALPCIACGVHGYSQAAHGSEGKGMGLKASDTELFPLCCDRPGVRGCHGIFDQGAPFTKAERREVEARWVAETKRRLGESTDKPANCR